MARISPVLSLRKPVAVLMCLAISVVTLVIQAAPAHAATCAGVIVIDLDLCKSYAGSLGSTGKVSVEGLGLTPQGVVAVQSVADARTIGLAISQLNIAPKTLNVGMIDRNGDGKYRKLGTVAVTGWPASGWFYGTTLSGVPKALGRGDIIVVSLKRDTFRWKNSILAGKVTRVD